MSTRIKRICAIGLFSSWSLGCAVSHAPKVVAAPVVAATKVVAAPKAVAFTDTGPSLTVQRPALYPETIEYDRKSDRFLLGSFREGAIYQVDRVGSASRLVDDPRLCSVLGIAVDAERGRLWAVNSDLGASIKPSQAGPRKLAGVGIYDLSTGKPLRYVDLAPLASGPHLMNGVAVDAAGNGYVSDSFSPVIYKIDPRGDAIVFLRDERFAGEGINLNGLTAHPDGYLLAIKKSDGKLFKIPLAEPTRVSTVEVAERFVGGDGLTLIHKNSLLIIANQTPTVTSNSAYALTSEDGWATAKVRAVQPLGSVYPTTAVVRGQTLYVLHSQLDELIQGTPEQRGELRRAATIRAIGSVSP